MRKLLPLFLVAATLIASSGVVNAGQIWTDGNGDGLPDGGPFMVSSNTIVTVGVWVDAQSFTWTNYLAYVEWTPGCLTYLGANYVVSGGSNFPIDDFSNPNAVGFGGNGFTQGGVDQIGNIILEVNLPVDCCVTPIIDIDNPFYTFSQLGAGSAYQLFTTNPGTCYGLDEPDGACCFPTGACLMLFAAECASQGGSYSGDGVTCAQAFCEVLPAGACCFATGACVVLQVSACEVQGGIYAGDGVTCAAANCPSGTPTEACCFADCDGGGCLDLLPADCIAAGGVPQGTDTACNQGICLAGPPCRGACCFPDGSCVDLITPAECADVGGAYAGDFVSCPAANCPQPTQACCFSNGTCADLVPADCATQGGSSQGAGTSCSTVACPQPTTGACCLTNLTCLENATSDVCGAAGGTWYPNLLCADVCDLPDAVQSKTWGNIKRLFR